MECYVPSVFQCDQPESLFNHGKIVAVRCGSGETNDNRPSLMNCGVPPKRFVN
jgi:hypothetical protein